MTVCYPGSVYAAAEKHPNIFSIAPDGILEMYVDNHILSSMRQCEGYYTEMILNHIQSKGRNWSLTFGIWFHKMMEYFYQAHKEDWKGRWKQLDAAIPIGNETFYIPQNVSNFIALGQQEWTAAGLESFAEAKQYKSLQGWQGAALLLLQYYNFHTNGNERLRVVGSEISFGRNKEVPLVEGYSTRYPFRAYLTGRIDLVVDNGFVIGPLDHKTTAYFDGSEGESYKPHEGMCGYTYTLRQLLGEKYSAKGRKVNTVIINHISLRDTKLPEDRFKRSFKSYTDAEFADYVSRMRRTCRKLFDITCMDEVPDWNTSLCTQMFYRDCPYKSLHEIAPSCREQVIQEFYQIGPAWNPCEKGVENAKI
jgi:hypothetical protein